MQCTRCNRRRCERDRGRPAPRPALPDWANPLGAPAGLAVRFREVIADFDYVTVCALADPTRVMIGFNGRLDQTNFVYVTPGPDRAYAYPVVGANSLGFLWFNIHDHGPMVQLEWRLIPPFTFARVQVTEVYALP